MRYKALYFIILLFIEIQTHSINVSCQDIPVKSSQHIDNQLQKLDSIVSFRVKGPFNKLVADDKDTYEYNAVGQVINERHSNWSNDKKRWYLRTETIIDVDTSRNCTVKTEWLRQYLSDFLDRGSRTEYYYNPDGKRIMTVNYEWDTLTNLWIGKWKSSSFLDKFGRDTLSLYYEWSLDDQNWKEVTRHSYAYDNSGCMNSISREDLNRNTGQMEQTGTEDNLCKKVPVPASDVDSCLDEASGKMFPCKFEEYSYDSNGDVIMEKEYTKSHPENKWKCTETRSYSYDSNRNMINKTTRVRFMFYMGYRTIEKFDFDRNVPIGVLIVPPGYRDLILGFIFNYPIPYKNCNNRINGYSNTIFMITRYRTKGVFYYSPETNPALP